MTITLSLSTQIVIAQDFGSEQSGSIGQSEEPLMIDQNVSYATDPVGVDVSSEYADEAMLRITNGVETFRVQDLSDIDNVVLNNPGNYTFYLVDENDGHTIDEKEKIILGLPIRTNKQSYLRSEQVRITLDDDTSLIEIRNLNSGDQFVPLLEDGSSSNEVIFSPQDPGEYRILCNNSVTSREYEMIISVESISGGAGDANSSSGLDNGSSENTSVNQTVDDIINLTESNFTIQRSQLPGTYSDSLRMNLSRRFSGISVEDARTIQTISGVKYNLRLKGRSRNNVDLLGAVLKNSTNATFFEPQGTATDIIRIDNITVNSATIELTKNSDVDAIARCENFNEQGACIKWVRTDIPFTDLGDRISFNVTHFSAYAGVLNNTYYYVENTTALNVSTTTQRTHAQMTFSDPVGSKWLIVAYSEYRMNATSTQGRLYLYSNGTEVARTEKRVTAATLEVNPFYYSYVFTGDGGDQIFKINASTTAATARVDLLQSRIIAIRLDGLANTDFNSTYNATTRSNVNNVWSDAVGDTVVITVSPSSAGTYLIGGSAIYNSDNTSGFSQMRMRLNGTEIKGTLYERDTNAAELHSGTFFSVEELSAAQYNITLEYASNTTSLSDWQQTSLFAIRLTDVFNFWHENVTAEQTTTNTLKSVANMTVNTYSNHNYTVFSSSLSQISSATNYTSPRTYINGAPVDNQFMRPAVAGEYVAVGTMDHVSGASTIVANTTTRSANATATARMKYSDIVLLELGNYEDPLTVSDAKVNTSGWVLNGTTIKVNATVTNETLLDFTMVQVTAPSYSYNASLSQNGNEWYNDTIVINETGYWNFTFYINDTVGMEKVAVAQDGLASNNIFVYVPGIVTVNITSPLNNTNVSINATFEINGTISCNGPDEALCGFLNLYAQYNSTAATPNANISNSTGALPLYIMQDMNPQNTTMNGSQQWNFSWQVNATGTNGSCYLLNIQSVSNISTVQDNNSDNIKICMIIQPAGPPAISNVTSISPVNPIAGSNVTVAVNFTATDSLGVGNINDSKALVKFSLNGLSRNGQCTPNDINLSSTTYNCSVSMPYYDPSGVWQVNVSVSNNQSLNASNSTTSFTLNNLVALGLSSASMNFGTMAPGTSNIAAASNPLNVSNLGNVNITGFNITAYSLINTTIGRAIGSGNISVNTSNAVGAILPNSTPVIIANSSIVVRNDTNSTMNLRSLFFFISTPLGTSSGNYQSQQNWVVTSNE